MKTSIKILLICCTIILLLTSMALAFNPLKSNSPSLANPDYNSQEVGLLLKILEK